MSRETGDFPVRLSTRLPDWSSGDLLQCSAARLSVCRVSLRIPRARHARLVADMLPTVRHAKTILTCRNGLKVANILVLSVCPFICSSVSVCLD